MSALDEVCMSVRRLKEELAFLAGHSKFESHSSWYRSTLLVVGFIILELCHYNDFKSVSIYEFLNFYMCQNDCCLRPENVDSFPCRVLVNNQNDAQFFHVCLFPFCTCFGATMYPSSWKLLCQCETWFMSPRADDRLVCWSICSFIPDT